MRVINRTRFEHIEVINRSWYEHITAADMNKLNERSSIKGGSQNGIIKRSRYEHIDSSRYEYNDGRGSSINTGADNFGKMKWSTEADISMVIERGHPQRQSQTTWSNGVITRSRYEHVDRKESSRKTDTDNLIELSHKQKHIWANWSKGGIRRIRLNMLSNEVINRNLYEHVDRKGAL